MTIFSIGNHIWKGGKMTIKETLEGLKWMHIEYEKRGGGRTQKIWLSHAIQILQAHEQAEGELKKLKLEDSDICKEGDNSSYIDPYNQAISIARPILAKALLELKGLRTKILEMSYEAIADGKKIEELGKK